MSQGLPQETRQYIQELERLWDFVSDMVEGGRLSEELVPDDYQALVSQMSERCEPARLAHQGVPHGE
ncbi:hypothetical protein J2T57_001424 [Natronocella acetinitrilica]|uniref:Uncharacterized protein n=1 Tax=Natronocella acetinitrilica TaxID=414046 RepID=A0AAE3G5N5_9GAMM|nr:hypothetical protein [Natronocella acetinitrilica]MCP1674322.1 hypothetical protein [Natronocella acetinitrilica]